MSLPEQKARALREGAQDKKEGNEISNNRDFVFLGKRESVLRGAQWDRYMIDWNFGKTS